MDEAEAERIKRQHTAELMQPEGVCGVGLRKDEKGAPLLVLFVDEKADPSCLPKSIDGLALVYERTGSFKAL